MSNNIPPSREVAVIESTSGKLAIVLQRGVGNNPGRFIQEINQDLLFSKKEPYWIKGHSASWVGKGSCLLIYFSTKNGVAYKCQDFDLFETKAPYNPDNVLLPYEVQVEVTTPKSGFLGFLFAKTSIETVLVQASSGEHAKTQIAQRGIGIVRLARPLKRATGQISDKRE